STRCARAPYKVRPPTTPCVLCPTERTRQKSAHPGHHHKPRFLHGAARTKVDRGREQRIERFWSRRAATTKPLSCLRRERWRSRRTPPIAPQSRARSIILTPSLGRSPSS